MDKKYSTESVSGNHNEIAEGVSYGTISHAAGTAKAAKNNELAGAVGSHAMVVGGVITAVLIPIVISQI